MRMRRFLHRVDPDEERGATILIVVLSLVVVFGMTVLVVDLGALIVKHRGLVNANDAAAVAAAASFARDEAQAGSNEDPAAGEADRFALANVGDAEHDTDWWTVTTGLSTSDCDQSSCGLVRVRYQAGQSLFFGPAIGLGDQVTAHGAATAIWGPAGGGRPAPITIHFEWLDQCGVPANDRSTECAFWLDGRTGGDDDDDSGGSEWAWINLEQWNVSAGASCPRVGSGDLSDWIAGRDVPQVRVNRVPTPTFVCTASGRAGQYFDDLASQEGTFKVLPVNDASGEFAPPGKTGDKYDIVGFTVLRIDDVVRGSDDGEPGDPHVPCPPISRHFDPDPPDNKFNLETEQGQDPCPLTGLHNPDDHQDLFPRIRHEQGNQRFRGGLAPDCQNVDYCYDAGSHVITWLAQTAENTRVDWLYVIPPTPGKCGIHELDPDAVCLVVSWRGYRSGGINPGGGVDFGLRAVRLSA